MPRAPGTAPTELQDLANHISPHSQKLPFKASSFMDWEKQKHKGAVHINIRV